MVGGWESGQTRQPPTPSDPPVCVCEQVSPLPSQTIEQALCLIGVSWWLPGGMGGEWGAVGIRHHSLTCVSGWEGRGT